MTSHCHCPSLLRRLVLPMLLLGLTSIHVYAQAPAQPLPALDPRELALVQRLRDQIVAAAAAQENPAPYVERIPGTEVSFSLRPVPAGTFLLGSPDSEKGRQPDEGPQVKVAVAAFWMGQHEVTWNEYEVFMFATDAAGSAGKAEADAVSHPTKPYVEMSFGMGREGFPAISMTHHAASKYCQWLSAKTKRFYRLPTEAEWEYAARAGPRPPIRLAMTRPGSGLTRCIRRTNMPRSAANNPTLGACSTCMAMSPSGRSISMNPTPTFVFRLRPRPPPG
jgi:hypothetical protein